MAQLLVFPMPASLIPVAASSVAIAVALVSLAYTQHQFRFASFILIAAFTLLAFYHSNDFTPDAWVNFIFARYQLIFLAHHGFLHCVLSGDDIDREKQKWQSQRRIGQQRTPARPSVRNGGSNHEHIKQNVNNKNHQSMPKPMALSPDWLFGYKLLFNPMLHGTTWEVRRAKKHNTASTASDNHKAASVTSDKLASPRVQEKINVESPPRHRRPSNAAKPSTSVLIFITQRLLSLLARYLVLCIIYDPIFHYRMPNHSPITADDYSPANRSLVTLLLANMFESSSPDRHTSHIIISHALALRSHHILHLLINEYLILSSYHDILAILFVGVFRLDSPSEWPPLFGSIREAYTVRRLWSEYWHLLIYRSFSGFVGVALSRLGLARLLGRSSSSRMLHNGLVFAMSGLMHVMVQWVHTDGACAKCGCWGIFVWFCLQIVGIAAEGAFCAVWKWSMKRYGSVTSWASRNGLRGCVKRGVGFLWVLYWLNWTIEVAEFPSLYCNMVA